MSWFKPKPSRPAFIIGTYKLDDPVLPGLREFSDTEYRIAGRQFKGERIFNAPPVEFLGHRWELQLGTVGGRIYRIAPYLALVGEREADPVATVVLQYCSQQLGKPASQKTGLSIWDTTDGHVILQTRETAEGLSISLFLTSKAADAFEENYNDENDSSGKDIRSPS